MGSKGGEFPTHAADSTDAPVILLRSTILEQTMNETRTSRPFRCPTSGQMLGALVSAFRLHQPSVGGPAAEFLGSGNAGKRSRDYFEGKWIPEETRHEICTWVVQALVHSQMLPALRLPPAPSGGTPETEQSLRVALFTWLHLWDAAFVAAAARWSAADAVLGGFVMGRQLVIDLALRWVTVCHLAGIDDPQVITVEDGRTGKARAILDAAMKRAGKSLTRDELAKALRSGRPGKINDRTVDRWYDGVVVPDDVNLTAMAAALTNSKAQASELLRFLRLQYGGLRLANMVRDAVGPRLCDVLLDGLVTFVRGGMQFSRAARESAASDPEQAYLFEIAAFKLLSLGSGDPVAAGWINAFLCHERGPMWYDDLQYAGNGATDTRVQACMRVVGDWPRLQAAVARHAAAHPGSVNGGRELLEVAALMSMNDNRVPPMLANWMKENPDRVHRIASNEQMKAATRAEQGTAAMNEGDHEGAIPHWARAAALETDPGRKSNYLFFHGCCLWQAKSRRYDDAIEALRESFRLWPESDHQRDRPFVEIAIVYQNRGWFEHALQHLDTDPVGFAGTSGHFNFVKGRTLHALQRWTKALECFQKAIDLNADSRPDAFAFGADCALELYKAQTNKELSQKGRDWAKKALHLGRPWAHDKWGLG